METKPAVAALSALAQDTRLAVFRRLVQAGPDGVAAGELARSLGVLPNTMSAHLTVLVHAGLVHSRRVSRSIFYTADYDRMSELLSYLLKDCCNGRPEICAPLADIAGKAAFCAPPAGSSPEATA